MGFEAPRNNAEGGPIKLTKDQFERLHNLSTDELEEEEIREEIKAMGITMTEPDAGGSVEVIVDGVPGEMATDRNDFGTLISKEAKEENETYQNEPWEEE